MKQSLSRARVSHRFLLMAIVMGAILVSSCAHQSRHVAQTTVLTEPSAPTVAKPRSFRLNINTSSATELEGLPGLGKILAARIVAHREQYGPFRRVEHLLMVPGFS